MLEVIAAGESDLTWRSITTTSPGVGESCHLLSTRSLTPPPPTFSNLKRWGKRTNACTALCKSFESLSQ